MMTIKALYELLDVSASRFPDNIAVEEAETGSMSYAELAGLSDRLRDRFRETGVGLGDRVGICVRKSGDAIASIFGIMKAGAAYVPTDPTAPASRNAYIFHNCAVKVVIVESRLADRLSEEFKQKYRHPAIKEAAVLALPDDDGVPIKAFTSTREGSKLSMIERKKFCSENLPLYMVPDLFCSLESLPKTSTDKVDYQKLKTM